nr:hypothetical protein B0A51_03931 [Rachicladosporium sp. CCFEE 5018]
MILVDNAALLNMRRTCRKIYYDIDEVFVARFFSNRKHLWTVQSLDVLVAITQQTRLARVMRRLEIAFWDFDRFLTPKLRARDRVHSRHNAVHQGDELIDHAFGVAQQETESVTAQGIAPLAQALVNLRSAGLKLTLAMSAVNIDGPNEAFGLATLLKSLGPRYATRRHVPDLMDFHCAGHTKYAQTSVWTIHRAKYRPSGFELMSGQNGTRPSIAILSERALLNEHDPEHEYGVLSMKTYELFPLFSTLISLNYTLQINELDRNSPPTPWGFRCPYVPHVMFQALTHLKELKLTFSTYNGKLHSLYRSRAHDRTLIFLAANLATRSLHLLKIRRNVTSVSTLLVLLKRNAATLRELTLAGIYIRPSQTWQSVFEFIANRMNLKRLSISDLRQLDHREQLRTLSVGQHEGFDRRKSKPHGMLTGEQEIKDFARLMAQQAKNVRLSGRMIVE